MAQSNEGQFELSNNTKCSDEANLLKNCVVSLWLEESDIKDNNQTCKSQMCCDDEQNSSNGEIQSFHLSY
jgi:hypothetical protein